MTSQFNIFTLLIYVLSLIPILSSTSIYDYTVSLTVLLILIAWRGGLSDFKGSTSLFNIFYIFFILLGVIGNNILRGFNNKLSTAVLLSFWCFNLSGLAIGYNRSLKTRLDPPKNINLIKNMSNLFITVGLVMGISYYLKIQTIPLLSAKNLEQRIAAISGAGIFLYFVRAGIYSSCILYFLDQKKKRNYLFLFITLNLMLLGTSFRGEFLQNMLLIWLANMHIKNTKITKMKILLAGLFIITLSFGLGLLRGDSPNLTSILLKFINMSSVGVYILDLVLTNFNNFQFGQTFLFGFGSILKMSTEFTQWLTKQLPMEFDGGVTPTIVGDFFINFGTYYWIPFLYLGYACRKIDMKFMNSKMTVIQLLFWTNMIIFIARSISGGISNMFLLATFSSLFLMLYRVLTIRKFI